MNANLHGIWSNIEMSVVYFVLNKKDKFNF